MPEPRKTEQREARLLAEWLALRFPKDTVRTQVRLGSPPILPHGVELEPGDRQLLKQFSRWADALIITPQGVMIVEASVFPEPGIVSQLLLYRALYLEDKDFDNLRHLPVAMLAVWGFEDQVLRRIAAEHSVMVEIYAPQWLAGALQARFPRSPRKTVPVRTPPL